MTERPNGSLPFSLDLEQLLGRPLPDDLTLKEIRDFFYSGATAQGLAKLSKFRRVRIRFVWNEEPPRDCADDMQLARFRELARQGMTNVIVDDGDGGLRLAAPVPELT